MKRHDFLRSGDPFIWLSGGALALILVLLFGLLYVIAENGLPTLWPRPVGEFKLHGQTVIGEIAARELIPSAPGQYRMQIKRGNRDLFGSDFVWADESQILESRYAPQLAVVEREEWGNSYGLLLELRLPGSSPIQGPVLWAAFLEKHAALRKRLRELKTLEDAEAARLNSEQGRLTRALQRASLAEESAAALHARLNDVQQGYTALQTKLARERAALAGALVLRLSNGSVSEIPLQRIVRAYRPNQMSLSERIRLYLSRVFAFIFDEPRESNTEGGVFPAIFGTVMMVLLMSAAAVPLGVLAAIYLHEYARQGKCVSLVRVAVNNLAGVPSIVFGVFGLGFFVYYLGGGIDRLFFAEALPNPTFGTGGMLWAALTLALLTMPTVIVTTEEGLAAIPRALREASYALGATKWETTYRIVLPSLVPAILTGTILAVARAAGEVAPLMITGVVKLAPALPIDGNWPFIHLDRKFMHLGFHIYDVGFQSPNVEAARPVVYMTTILLLLIVIVLNTAAIIIRNRLRARFSASSV